MDDLVDRVGKVEGSVVQVSEDVNEMKPVTDDMRKWKLMGMGALAVVGLGGTALGVSIAGFFEQLSRFFKKKGVMAAPQSELTWPLIRLVTPLFLLRRSVST